MGTETKTPLDIRKAKAASLSRETRNFAVRGVELRQEGDSLLLAGHASVFEVEYDVFGGPPFGWTESVSEGAFTKTLREKPDVQLLVNHEGAPLARTKSGTLLLEEDDVGLKVEASLEPADPDVQALRFKMQRRDMDEMSFAFRVLKQEWDEDYTRRKILEVSLDRGDVSVVNYGANPATSAQLRASDLISALTQVEPEEFLAEVRAAGQLELVRHAYELLGQALIVEIPPADEAPAGESLSKTKLSLAKRQLELL